MHYFKNTKLNLLVLITVLAAGLVVVSQLGLFNSPKRTQIQPLIESTIKNNLQRQSIDEIGLSFQIPTDTTFRKEVADNTGKIRVLGFYIEKIVKDKPSYMLYGVYQADKEATEQDLEIAKKEMDPSSIKQVTIGGYNGIEGLVLGPKTRYITILLKNNRLLSVSTIPPTQENKLLTDQILASFEFN